MKYLFNDIKHTLSIFTNFRTSLLITDYTDTQQPNLFIPYSLICYLISSDFPKQFVGSGPY